MLATDDARLSWGRGDWILPRIAFVASVSIVAVALLASTAAAQDAVASARALFTEGVQLSTDRQFAQAEARFREALSLHDAPAIRYNLASVLAEQSEYPEARELTESVLGDPTAPDAIRELATTLATQIDGRAGYVRIALHGSATVAIDAWTLTDAGAEIPVAPGAHTITATRDGAAVASAEVTVQTAEHATVQLDAAPIATIAEPEVPVAPVAPAAEAPVTDQWWFWAGIVVSVIGAAAVITAIVLATPSDAPPAYQGNFEPGILHW